MKYTLHRNYVLATTLGLDTGKRAGARSLLNGRGRAHRLGQLGPVAKAWPAVQRIDAAQLSGVDQTYFATVAWLASICRELEAQPLGTVDIEWVYNSMPPAHGQIYPEVPLEPVIEF